MDSTSARPLLGALLAQHQLRLQFKVIDSLKLLILIKLITSYMYVESM